MSELYENPFTLFVKIRDFTGDIMTEVDWKSFAHSTFVVSPEKVKELKDAEQYDPDGGNGKSKPDTLKEHIKTCEELKNFCLLHARDFEGYKYSGNPWLEDGDHKEDILFWREEILELINAKIDVLNHHLKKSSTESEEQDRETPGEAWLEYHCPKVYEKRDKIKYILVPDGEGFNWKGTIVSLCYLLKVHDMSFNKDMAKWITFKGEVKDIKILRNTWNKDAPPKFDARLSAIFPKIK